MNREEINKYCDEFYPDSEILLLDGFDEAAIGMAHGAGMEPKMIYDEDRCIEILEKDGMSHEEALEYFSFNVSSAFVGAHTPCFLSKLVKFE